MITLDHLGILNTPKSFIVSRLLSRILIGLKIKLPRFANYRLYMQYSLQGTMVRLRFLLIVIHSCVDKFV